MAPSDHQDGHHDDHVVQDQGDDDDANLMSNQCIAMMILRMMMRNLMCESEGEGGDEKSKTEKDEGEECLAKLDWVFHWGLLMIMVLVMVMMMVMMGNKVDLCQVLFCSINFCLLDITYISNKALPVLECQSSPPPSPPPPPLQGPTAGFWSCSPAKVYDLGV